MRVPAPAPGHGAHAHISRQRPLARRERSLQRGMSRAAGIPVHSRRGGRQTYWSQYTTTTTSQTTGAAGTAVNAGDTAPTNDQWNLVAIELLSDD